MASMARLPQISLPLASADGLPVGLGLIAAHGNDEMLLEIMVALGVGAWIIPGTSQGT
jgi:amidase